MLNRVLLISGSPEFDSSFIQKLQLSTDLFQAPVYAIDKGLELCHLLDIRAQKIIGDFDSVNPILLTNYSRQEIHQYPTDKDISDTELAIELALEAKFTEIILLNATGARMDHFLFNALLAVKYPQIVKILATSGLIWACDATEQQTYHIPFQNQTVFSLIPWGECSGVSIKGAKYPLHNHSLRDSTLTLSNIALGPITMEIETGKLLVYSNEWKTLLS